MSLISEAFYPINFRQDSAKALGEQLKKRHSVVLIGMKRVGISNFLRFFLNHEDIAKTYIDLQNHLFIPVDLNDLVETELYPFWVLTLKRIIDAADKTQLSAQTKKELQHIFLDSIQSNDIFLVIEAVRKALTKIVEENFTPTIFFIRFDRIKDALNEGFFQNLEGLKEATHLRLSFVITAYRSLDELFPKLVKDTRALFSDTIYLLPAEKDDAEIIFNTTCYHYNLKLSDDLREELFELTDGYTQYLLLSIITLSEFGKIKSKEELKSIITNDETIKLQSEELWESLTEDEQNILQKIVNGKKLTVDDKTKGKYLKDTGLADKNFKIFSPLFELFIKDTSRLKTETGNSELSKKEFLLFNLLKANLNEVVEREKIAEVVWREEEELGVSDWAIDRLVSRLRNKLKQDNFHEIVTVKTRGFKLTTLNQS